MKATIEERTNSDARRSGIRSFMVNVSRESSQFTPATHFVIAITSVVTEDISLDGEAPQFSSLPDQVMGNTDLARTLTFVATHLLGLPHMKVLPSITLDIHP